MQCLLLFKDALGQLPSAEELRRRGFRVSSAALAPDPAPADQFRPLALAAETPAPYGDRPEQTPPPPALPMVLAKDQDGADGA